MHASIGIIADSHGEAGRIEAALSFLKAEGCRTIYHLGDICDSYHLSESSACIKRLRESQVLAIKGNNDHVITRFHSSHQQRYLSKDEISYLDQLPLVREHRSAILAHSLPFEQELGLSCMIRPMDEDQAALFFKRFPGRLLFRGHSHDPVIIRNASPSPEVRPLRLDTEIDLTQQASCIVTCGALTENLCLIWQPDSGALRSVRF